MIKEKVDLTQLIATDPDFIAIKRYGYSLEKLLKRYPEGAPAKIIAAALEMPVEELETKYLEIIEKLRNVLNVNND